jgi:hypothetical protein
VRPSRACECRNYPTEKEPRAQAEEFSYGAICCAGRTDTDPDATGGVGRMAAQSGIRYIHNAQYREAIFVGDRTVVMNQGPAASER